MTFPAHWATATLADITTKVGSGATPRGGGDARDGKGAPVFGSNGRVGNHSAPTTNGATIVVGRKGSVGEVHFSEQPCSPIDTTYFIDAFETMEPRLLVWLLKSLPLAELNRSTAIPGLNREDAYKLPVSVPPRAEQQRIVAKLNTLLGRVDACRERLERVEPLIKRFRQSVLEAVMTGTLTADLHAQGAAPEWEPAELGDVADVGTGSTPLRSKAGYFADKGKPWVTSAATSQRLITAANEFVTPAAVQAHRLRLYPPGTLLVAMYGEGKTRGQVAELGIAATINQACAAITVNSPRVTKEFLKLALQSNYLTMRAMAEGGNQPNLNLSKVRAVKLMLPGVEEQIEIVRRVGRLFALADAMEVRLALARRAATALTPATLAKAFRGELVPQDPADEPADQLLARIRAERAAATTQTTPRKPGRPAKATTQQDTVTP